MTNIALIPKGNTQKSMKDWRLIALCNVLYKLIAKFLANQLKLILHKYISDNQLAFVPDKTILDNTMVAIEVIHFMKTKTRGQDKYVALKLDISKAYDIMDWEYLKEVMIKMGFNQKWIQWMVMSIEFVDYSVLVNGEHVGPVIPGRGLRQGDPLSLYLFIICAESLSSLIRDAEERQVISGTSICHGAPPVSHLLFADDCFLFFKAKDSQAHVMKNILNIYEAASGQAISLPKSRIFYSRNVSDELKHQVTSKVGREVMIKSVLQAIPSYVTSIFQLPSTLITTIERMINSFWWDHGRTSHRGIKWMSWENFPSIKLTVVWVSKIYRLSI